MREIVDILGSTGKVRELGMGRQFRVLRQALLQVVLDSFDVMVRSALDLFDPRRLLRVEAVDNFFQVSLGVAAERAQFRDAGVRGEYLQPANLDDQAVAQQSILAKDGLQLAGLLTVAAVHRRDGGQARKFHTVAPCPLHRVRKRYRFYTVRPWDAPAPLHTGWLSEDAT